MEHEDCGIFFKKNIDEFVGVFKELESLLREKYKIEKFSEALNAAADKDHVIKNNETFIKKCADLRNINLHESLFSKQRLQFSLKKNDKEPDYFSVPSSEQIEKLRGIIARIRNPKVKDMNNGGQKFFVPRDNIYVCKPEFLVRDVIAEMRDKTYSHVPIIGDHGHVIGVFGDDVLGNVLKEERSFGKQDPKIEDVLDYCKFEGRHDEILFKNYETVTLENIEDSFAESIKSAKPHKLSLILLTEDGNQSGELKGLVTIWDMFRVVS